MSEDRIKELEAEVSRLRTLCEERNRIAGTVTLQLREIAAAVFPDYPMEDDFARLVHAVKSLVERQVSVPLIAALQFWLEARERRSATSITNADAWLAAQAEAWLAQASSTVPCGVYAAVGLLNRALRNDPVAMEILMEHRAATTEAMAKDPTIQCVRVGKATVEVGVLGIINGIFGTRKDSTGWISMVCEVDGAILRFEVNEPLVETPA
jgi:hypothetical protein